MRVYLALTWHDLATAWSGGAIPASTPAHAVTPALREWYVDDDIEHLEYVATSRAARDCLRLLRRQPDAARRVVVAAEVDEDTVRTEPGAVATQSLDHGDRAVGDGAGDRTRIQLVGDVRVADVAAVLLDDPEAEGVVRAAVEALPAAESGDDDAAFTVDETDGHELLWYAPQEIAHLLVDA